MKELLWFILDMTKNQYGENMSEQRQSLDIAATVATSAQRLFSSRTHAVTTRHPHVGARCAPSYVGTMSLKIRFLKVLEH